MCTQFCILCGGWDQLLEAADLNVDSFLYYHIWLLLVIIDYNFSKKVHVVID